jgi:type II secretory pathway pseudopilin PulG
MIDTFSPKLPDPASEGGFMLIEVLISAMLVALIAVGTFSGFASGTRASASERAHAQATVIAQQDEERLRGMTVTQLTQTGTSATPQTVAENGLCVEQVASAWSYCAGTSYAGQKYTATVFTVTSKAQFVTAAAANETFTCETSGGAADYIQTTSSVEWPSIGKHSPVSQSSLVAVPVSGALLVRVKNRENAPVAGATAELTATGATQITPSTGCVIFGGLAEETIKVAVSKGTWVDHNGNSPPPTQAKQVSPSALATAEFTIEAPGAINAKFVAQEKGKTVEALGDTFVAVQSEIAEGNDVAGSASTYKTSQELAGLFPFGLPSKPNPYTVYAGDCAANNPVTVTKGTPEAITQAPSAQVEPNGSTPVNIEVPLVNVIVYEGTETVHGSLDSKAEVKITNSECSSAKSNNLGKVPYEHKIPLTSQGELLDKYQPYAKKLKICVSEVVSGTRYKYTLEFPHVEKAGSNLSTIYLKNTANKTATGTAGC